MISVLLLKIIFDLDFVSFIIIFARSMILVLFFGTRVIILFVALTVTTMKLKGSGIFSEEQIEEEMEDWIEDLETQIDDENSG